MALSLLQLREALGSGLEWLRLSQESDGSWPDFVVSPTTEGREWTTGYVGTLLGRRGADRGSSCTFMLSRARTFLRASCRPTGGWGFAATIPVDADSTAWCLLALLSSNDSEAENFMAERQELRRHQHAESGGFSTYRLQNFPSSYERSGYFAPTPCVTASVALALHKLRYEEDRDLVDRAIEYLWLTRERDGWWRSFWWELGIYSTAIVIDLFVALKRDHPELALTRKWLERMQHPSGSWLGERVQEPNAFLTALAIDTLLDLDVAIDTPSVEMGLLWLLKSQHADGSWKAPPIMKVPNQYEPWNPAEPYIGLMLGGDRRNLVTATVVSALARCIEYQQEPDSSNLTNTPSSFGDPNVEDDVRRVIETFESYTNRLPEHLRTIAFGSPVWARPRTGLGLYLPFWLDTTLAAGRLRETARQMALANRFGQFFCLLQDDVLDHGGDTSASVLLPVDALFFQFIHIYQTLFSATNPFWQYFERYWVEYLDALAWERRSCRRPRRYDRNDFVWLQRKYSPIKICCAGMALLAQRLDALSILEELVENLQVAWQLSDDIHDCREDLRHNHWTWPLSLAWERVGRAPSIHEVDHLIWEGGLARVIIEAEEEYLEKARQNAQSLGLGALDDWIGRFIGQAEAGIRHISHYATVPRQPGSDLKLIRDGDEHIAFNVSTGVLFSVDRDIASVIERLPSGTGDAPHKYRAVIDELKKAGALTLLPPPTGGGRPSVTNLFVNASASNTHRCFTCIQATSRPGHTATAVAPYPGATVEAIDTLLLQSPSTSPLNISFLSDQRISPTFISTVVTEARQKAVMAGKTIRFSLIVNPLAPDLNVINAIGQSGGYVHLSHDNICDASEINQILSTVAQIREFGVEKLGINVGLLNYEGGIADLLTGLDQVGLKPIGVQSRRLSITTPVARSKLRLNAMREDFETLLSYFERSLHAGRLVPLVDVLYPLMQVYRREQRTIHCGAGTSMIALTADGSVFPCFRLCDQPALQVDRVGAVPEKQPLAVYQESTVDLREPCRSCWARYLCGGGCYDDHLRSHGSVLIPDPAECEFITYRYEEIIKLAARICSFLPTLSRRVDDEAFITFLPTGPRSARLAGPTKS